eukprot:11258390-Ditylum_brightwellii.AAC.1
MSPLLEVLLLSSSSVLSEDDVPDVMVVDMGQITTIWKQTETPVLTILTKHDNPYTTAQLKA